MSPSGYEVTDRVVGNNAWRDANGPHYVRVWHVDVDQVDYDNPRLALETASIPDYGEAYPHDAAALARKISVADTENRELWEVTVLYERPTPGTGAVTPLSDDVRIRWGSIPYMRVLERDIYGNAILNSANDPFDPPLEQELRGKTVTIVRNESDYDPGVAAGFEEYVNHAQVQIAGFTVYAGQARCVEYSGESDKRAGVDYWSVTYVIHFVPYAGLGNSAGTDSWAREVLDQGFYYYNSDGKKTRIVIRGSPVVTPKLLDGNGGILPGELGSTGVVGSAVFLSFDTYPPADFDALDLGGSAL